MDKKEIHEELSIYAKEIIEKFNNGLFEKICPKNFLASIIANINYYTINALKDTIHIHLGRELKELLYSHRVIAYKLGDNNIRIEIFMKPLKDLSVLEYHILVKEKGEFELTRIR